MRINSWPAYSALGVVLITAWAGTTFAAAGPARVGFHEARLDGEGKILPWYADEPGIGYDKALNLVWFYWVHMLPYWDFQPDRVVDGVKLPARQLGAIDLPKYMLFRTQETLGVGGDQFAMLLSSWALYYQYSGDPAVKSNMIYLADTYLAHSLSPDGAAWPHLPYPCNSGTALLYDGDLVFGKDVTQPDKAGSFGAELVSLYEMTGNEKYLIAAAAIADVLAAHTVAGDAEHSPLPFRVNTRTGEVRSAYTTNWTGALRLFQELERLHKGNLEAYRQAFQTILAWMKRYPLGNNKWGPFFEDVNGWSDTEINAGTFAWYLMEHKSWDENWREDARRIQDWVIGRFGNKSLLPAFGVMPINEQTVYEVPGQSHTSRHASIEVRYAAETGDLRNKDMAVRQLNWATYFVDDDGKNKYPDPHTFEIWWTDGYGDYVRHYLRAMAADPELAPSGQSHLLQSTSAVREIRYVPHSIQYRVFDAGGSSVLRLAVKPSSVTGDDSQLSPLSKPSAPGWSWQPLSSGGVLHIRHGSARSIAITL